MKKVCLLISFFCVFFAKAQELKMGLQAGLLLPKLDVEEIEKDLKKQEFKGSTGFQAGAVVHLRFNSVYLQVEPTYSRMGGKVNLVKEASTGNQRIEVSEKFAMSRFDVPMLLGVRLGLGEVVGIRFNAGPMASLVLGNKSFRDDLNEAYNEVNKSIDSKDIKNFQVAYQAGVGVDVLKLALDVRYEGMFGDYVKTDFMKLSTKQFVIKASYFF